MMLVNLPSLLKPVRLKPRKKYIPPIWQWSEDDRPREKLQRKGAVALSNAELLAILINCGQPDKSAVELAQEILLFARNNLAELARITADELQQFKGIGKAKATTILAALELSRRRQACLPQKKPVLNSPSVAAAIMKPLLEDLPCETLYVLFLNHANKLLHYSCISNGGITATTVDPRVVFQEALTSKATRIMLCHNHPSGLLKASTADINITRKLSEAGRFLDIEVLDHLIVSNNGYYSFKEQGLL